MENVLQIKKRQRKYLSRKHKGNVDNLKKWREIHQAVSDTKEKNYVPTSENPSHSNDDITTIITAGQDNAERHYLESRLGTKIIPCGLFVDNNLPYLAASPDGLVGNDSIVEIKCPASIKEYTPEEAFYEKKLKCVTYNDGNLQLNVSHAYFYQIQGQLHITNKKFCYFCIWTPKEKIERDDKFWADIEPKLKKFYMECLLPEIIDSRLDRGLPLRKGL